MLIDVDWVVIVIAMTHDGDEFDIMVIVLIVGNSTGVDWWVRPFGRMPEGPASWSGGNVNFWLWRRSFCKFERTDIKVGVPLPTDLRLLEFMGPFS